MLDLLPVIVEVFELEGIFQLEAPREPRIALP